VAKLVGGLVHVLTPLIFLAVPCTIVSVVCGVLGIAIKSRQLLITAACCSVPTFLYVLMGEAWWRPVVPIITGMYFAAAYALPKRRALAAGLVAPYFIFVAMLANAVYLS
jgi:hypothetical protein